MQEPLKQSQFNTPLGPMVAIANDHALYLLEFLDRKGLEQTLRRLRKHHPVTLGITPPLISIQQELAAYFSGKLQTFKTPWVMLGTVFQQDAWTALLRVPYGETRSYLDQAQLLQRPNAFRAVANANGANQLAIVIPCHRIIKHNGGLGGYGGGLERKCWLLNHEQLVFNNNKVLAQLTLDEKLTQG